MSSGNFSDVIYVNTIIPSPQDGALKLAKYDISYDDPIIDNPSDYFMSVTKFEIPLLAVPLLIAPIVANQIGGTPFVTSGTASQAVGPPGPYEGKNMITTSDPVLNVGMAGATVYFAGGQTAIIKEVFTTTNAEVLQTQTIPASDYIIIPGRGESPFTITGSASQTLTTVTTSDPICVPNMRRGLVIFANGQSADIVSVDNPTTLTVSQSTNIASQGFTIINNNLTSINVGVVQRGDGPFTPFTAAVIWKTQITELKAPIQNQEQQVINLYYYDYSYDHFANLVSEALNVAWIEAGSPGTTAPAIFWDTDRGMFIFSVNLSMVDLAVPNPAAPDGWTVFYDDEFLSIIPGFHEKKYDDRYHLEIIPNPNYVPDHPVKPAVGWDDIFNEPVNTMFIKPSYSSIVYFSSFRKLLITTNGLPVQREYYPIISESGSVTGANSTLGVITDFQLDIAKPGDTAGIAVYDADIYKLISMNGDTPLRKLDYQLFWTDRYNNLFPIQTVPYQSISVKFAFFHKSLYQDFQ